ncbi:hypothetical protein GGQ60_000651 [Pedobacter zeae]|uniref:Uncharacterized protein n=1 Tax=Pedobacter zeae TaxID=1737356 RepID=A0A7W6K7N5_9SPHI|nr:hypothetical protein [Pedobacter zeae]
MIKTIKNKLLKQLKHIFEYQKSYKWEIINF